MASSNPYTQFKNDGYDNNGIPLQYPPPYAISEPNSTVVVTQPGAVMQVQNAESAPSSFLWLSIIAWCFCWPMAICAIVFSHQSSFSAGAGDYTTARQKGRTAMGLALGAVGIGILAVAASIGVYVKTQQIEIELGKTEYRISTNYLGYAVRKLSL